MELFKGIGDDYKDVSDRATECQSFIDSITAFDEAKSLLDDKNAELDKAISEANDLVNGENTALDESLRSLLETKISETKAIKITAPTMAETVKEIDTQTTEMNKRIIRMRLRVLMRHIQHLIIVLSSMNW